MPGPESRDRSTPARFGSGTSASGSGRGSVPDPSGPSGPTGVKGTAVVKDAVSVRREARLTSVSVGQARATVSPPRTTAGAMGSMAAASAAAVS
ncbi:hypothetical protein ADK38_00085, partial [Streptomyces varsoviensis]